MKSFKIYIVISLVILIATSCTKVIDLKLGNVTGQLVIEGNITNLFGTQVVKLSQNVPFTSTNTYPAVTGASVIINDSRGNTYPLTESTPGTYTLNSFAGRSGNSYTMTVLTNGNTYTATSQMPLFTNLDSITTRPNEFKSSMNRREVTVHFADRAGIANQYRFILTVNGVQANDVFVFNNSFNGGRLISIDLIGSDINIYPGDNVTVEMQCIDLNVYTYWFSLMQQDNPGEGIAPSNPPTNISPAVLGYFSAHTTQTKSIVVK